MDPRLASVLTSGSPEVRNGSRRGEGPGPAEFTLDPKDKTSPGTKPGNLKSCLEAAATIRQDAQSLNGKKPEVGGTCEPASQETSKTGGSRRPIAARPGGPALRGRSVRIKVVVPPRHKRPITASAARLTKDRAAAHVKGPVVEDLVTGEDSSQVWTGEDSSQVWTGEDSSQVWTGEDSSQVLTGEDNGHIQTGEDSSHIQTGEDSIHIQTGEDNGHIQTGEDSSHIQTGEDNGHIQTGEDSSHIQTGEDSSHIQTGEDNGHIQTGEDSSHIQTGEDSSHIQTGEDNGHIQTGEDNGHIQTGEDSSHIQTGEDKGRVWTGSDADVTQQISQRAHEEAESKDRNDPDVKTAHADGSEMGLAANTDGVKELNCERAAARPAERRLPQILHKTNSKSLKRFEEAAEQTEPLDLSLPRRRESRARTHGRLAGESSLIMEVDEYEGDGDRDMVEDDNTEGSDGPPCPSFFSTSVLASLSSLDCDTENLLLIDDQGIPYTLGPDGLKVPQVDASTSDPVASAEQGEPSSAPSAALAGSSLSQSLARAPGEFDTAADEPSSNVGDQTHTPELFTRLLMSSEPPELSHVQEANTGLTLPAPPVQILANPPTNPPLLLLSSSSPSLAAGLSLPLSVTPASPGASTHVLLLLSVSPSDDDSASTSTAFAVLDPSTGQLSQVTAASAPLSLPLSPGHVGGLAPALSNPILRLSPSSSPLVLSGVSNVSSGPVLASLAVPLPALQDGCLSADLQTQPGCSEPNAGSEAISTEKSEIKKPSTTSPQPAAPEPLAPPTSQVIAQSPASEPERDSSGLHSEHLPLDDHLYFSNSAAPPSPPMGPLLPSAKLEPLEALDPLSPEESPASLGSRRVLCCQLCPRIFFYISDLERHAITHSQKKPHVCQQCGKAFKRSSHLQRHKHIHTGQRNFVCPICSKRFREAGELQRHQRVHTGEKPYQCQLCHTRFAERNTLRRHTKRKHPFHQAAMEMLNERRDRGGDGGGGGTGGVQEEEESAEWYSSAVSTLDNSESDMET